MEYNMGSVQVQEQSQVLSPRMMQSLNILQMPSTELYEYLISEVEANPVISFDSIDFAERKRRNAKHKYSNYENSGVAERYTDDGNNPAASLRLQMSMLNTPCEVERLGFFLIQMLDENGYLDRDELDRIASRTKVSPKILQDAIKLLQSLDPAGVGAFTLQECILLQLERKGLVGCDSWIIAENYLELLGKNKLPLIAKKSNIPLHRVVNAQQLIRTLNPKPLLQEASVDDIEYITPDILILKAGKGFVVELNQLSADSISIDNTYSQLLRETDSNSVREFLGENLKKAQWLRDSIRQRCETLMDCTTELLRYQRAFFEYGPNSLKPYSRREMAEHLDRSESTISRAFKDKYIECDWGMFPSDYFFPKQTGATHPEVTKTEIESIIQNIIENEDRQHPMSDTAIAQTLVEQGIPVSRRTVTKYRDEMGIPSTARRKNF